MSLPIPNLDDKTFSDLVEEAKRWIPIYAPEWTDHNVHDPGITLIELFAWLAEMQLYRLNTITEKNKLKFLKLLGLKPKPATAAKADVTFTLDTKSVLVPARTKVAAKDTETGEDIIFETDRDIRVVSVKLARIISQGMAEIRDCTEANKLDGHFYRAFGERAEEGGTLYLGFDQPFPDDEEIDFMVYLYEADLIERGKHWEEEPEIIPSAEVRWEYSTTESNGCEWTELEMVRDETLALLCSGTISFRTPKDMAKCTVPPFDEERYWIRCRVVKAGYEIPPRIDAIRLNTVRVEQGETVEAEIIGSGTGHPNQTFFLQQKPILAGSQVISVLNINKLSVDVAEGATSLQLNSVPGLQNGDKLKIEDGTITKVECPIINKFAIMVQKMRFAHSAATTEIKKVEEVSPIFIYKLSVDVAEAANNLQLNNVQGLKKDDLLRINDPDRIEYVIIKSVFDTTVTLTSKLLYTHNANSSIEKVKVKKISSPYKLSVDVIEGASSLLMDKVPALQKYDILKIEDSNADKVEYRIISRITIVVQKIRFAHCATTPIKKVRVEEFPSEQDKTWMDWKDVDDFDASGPEDPHYVIDYDTGEILFGDGVHGLIPPKGETNIKASSYRFGGGERGNIKAEAINMILDVDDEELKMLTVTNASPAHGGAEEETLEEAIIRARKDLKERYRAVTSQDYEYIAKATPGLRVKRAKAISEDGSVTVVVVPESPLDKPVPSEGFRTTVCLHLDKHRLITTGIHVIEPDYVKVSVNAEVKIRGGYESDNVRHRLENALKTFLHPLKGGPEGVGWPFGRSVFKSEINELIDGVEGVDCVQKLNMVDEEYSYDGEKINIPKSGLVYSGKHSIRIIVPEEECRVEGGFP